MKRFSTSISQLIIFIIFLSLTVTLLNMFNIPNPFYNPFLRPASNPRPIDPAPAELGADEKQTITVFKEMSPSVVYITHTSLVQENLTLDIFTVPKGSGSGFVWDHNGHVVTNYHVVIDAESIDITLYDQSVWRALLVGGDSNSDLAVLRIVAIRLALMKP